MKLAPLIIAVISCLGVQRALAQPSDYVDLGRLVGPATLSTPIHLRIAEDVAWFRMESPAVSSTAGFIDVWTRFEVLSASSLQSVRGIVFDNDGHIVCQFAAPQSWGQLYGSVGQTSPRRPQNIVNGDFGDDEGGCYAPFAGRWGSLDAGVYWLAVANEAVGAYHGWDVRVYVSPSRQAERDTTLYIRVQPPDVPFCDPDLNWDGNADQDDVAYLLDLVTNPSPIDPNNVCGADPDHNRDGTADFDDVLALVDVIAGGGCP